MKQVFTNFLIKQVLKARVIGIVDFIILNCQNLQVLMLLTLPVYIL
jgi:hypothetical protein